MTRAHTVRLVLVLFTAGMLVRANTVIDVPAGGSETSSDLIPETGYPVDGPEFLGELGGFYESGGRPPLSGSRHTTQAWLLAGLTAVFLHLWQMQY